MSFLKHYSMQDEHAEEPKQKHYSMQDEHAEEPTQKDFYFDDALAISDLILQAHSQAEISAIKDLLSDSKEILSEYGFLVYEVEKRESEIEQDRILQDAIFAESLEKEDLREFLQEFPELRQFDELVQKARLDTQEIALWGLDILDRAWQSPQGQKISEELEEEISTFIAAGGDTHLPDLWLKILGATEYVESDSPEAVNPRVWELFGLNDQQNVIVLLPGEYDKNYGVENWFEREIDARQYIEDIGVDYFDIAIDQEGGFFVIRTKERFETQKHTQRPLAHGQHVTKQSKKSRSHDKEL